MPASGMVRYSISLRAPLEGIRRGQVRTYHRSGSAYTLLPHLVDDRRVPPETGTEGAEQSCGPAAQSFLWAALVGRGHCGRDWMLSALACWRRRSCSLRWKQSEQFHRGFASARL